MGRDYEPESVHHQSAARRAERRLEAASVKPRFAQVGAVQHQVILAGFVSALLGAHFFSFSIENAQHDARHSGQSEPQQSHFDERIWRILKQFYSPFGLWMACLDVKLRSNHGD